MRTPQIMLPVILILCTLISINAQPNDPDLGVSLINPTCDNLGIVKDRTNADTNRLTGFKDGNLASAKAAARNAYDLVQRVRSTPLSGLLQVQRGARSEVGVASKLALELASFEKQLTSEDINNPFYSSLIVEQARETAQVLSEIRERAASESEQNNDLNGVCQAASDSIQKLIDYLNGLEGRVKKTLEELGANLNKGNTLDCELITATGQYSGNLNVVNKGNGVRTEIITVTFAKPFSVTPSVGVGLLGYDMDINSNQILLEVVWPPTATNFQVRVTAINGVRLNFVHFSYIATITPRSGIYVGTTSMAQDDRDAQIRQYNVPYGKMKIVTKQLAAPILNNRKSITVLTGYSQDAGVGKLTRLDVTITDSTLYFLVMADTNIFSAATTNIYWSGDNANLDSRYLPTTFLGPIASGAGDRTDTSASLDLSRYLAKPEIFIGISVIDMDNRVDGYRMKHIFPGGNHPNYPVNFNTWNSGYNGQSCDGVFLACRFNDKKSCLV